VNPAEVMSEMRRLSGLLDSGLKALRTHGIELAENEAAYRRARALAFVEAPEGTVPEREAWVDSHTADARNRRDMAEALRVSALEAVRSRRTQISALQTIANAHREEAAFARTGPEL
jgi:hypothetical protein